MQQNKIHSVENDEDRDYCRQGCQWSSFSGSFIWAESQMTSFIKDTWKLFIKLSKLACTYENSSIYWTDIVCLTQFKEFACINSINSQNNNPWGKDSCFPHLTEDETEAHRSSFILPGFRESQLSQCLCSRILKIVWFLIIYPCRNQNTRQYFCFELLSSMVSTV